jgi:hypothetical protein
MGRQDMPMEERRPFYLYVDEFQNFATDSFATILSEARKYGLNLTIANQYISQMSEEVRSAVFGNVGTILCFRISPDDAPFLQKYFEPQFEAADLIQQHSRFFVTTMMIADEKAPAFSAKTLNLPLPPDDLSSRIIALSREKYTQEHAVVEKLVRQNAGLAIDAAPAQPQLPSAKPKVQAQLNHVQAIENQQADNKDLGKAVGANILQAFRPPAPPADNPPDEPKKRRRGKRGGRKHKKGGANTQPVVIAPSGPAGDEQTIQLR